MRAFSLLLQDYMSNFAYKQNNFMMFGNQAGGGGCLTSVSGGGADTTNNTFNSRWLPQVPTTSGGVTDIVLFFPGFLQEHSGGIEQDIPTEFTVTAAIEYPIGTFHQVFFDGSPIGKVTPGRRLLASDPCGVFIPAGATFGVKVFGAWIPGTFYFSGGLSSTQHAVEWTHRGANLADNTLTTATFTSTTAGLGYAPLVAGITRNRIATVGVLGDSIGAGAAGSIDQLTWTKAWGRGLRNRCGFVNLSVGGSSTAQYLSRYDGANLIWRDKITHLFFELGRNDLTVGRTFAQLREDTLAILDPFLNRGVQVTACTIMPHTSSTNGFIDAAGQAISSSTGEGYRQEYNAWLLGSYKALGFQRICDIGHAVDPGDTGKWSADVGAGANAVAIAPAGLQSVLTGDVVSSVTRISAQSGTANAGYPANGTLQWVAAPYFGETGWGATGTALVDSNGHVSTTIAVTSGGGGYSYPPLINIIGPWTADGVHPSPRGYNQLLSSPVSGYGPDAFTF